MIPATVWTCEEKKGYSPKFKGYFLAMVCTLHGEILVLYVALSLLGALVGY